MLGLFGSNPDTLSLVAFASAAQHGDVTHILKFLVHAHLRVLGPHPSDPTPQPYMPS